MGNFAHTCKGLTIKWVFRFVLSYYEIPKGSSNNASRMGESTLTVTHFGVSHCINFQGCKCLSVSHLTLLKDFHNIFAYYVRI